MDTTTRYEVTDADANVVASYDSLDLAIESASELAAGGLTGDEYGTWDPATGETFTFFSA